MKKSKNWKIEIMESAIVEPTEKEEEIKVENDHDELQTLSKTETYRMEIFDSVRSRRSSAWNMFNVGIFWNFLNQTHVHLTYRS